MKDIKNNSTGVNIIKDWLLPIAAAILIAIIINKTLFFMIEVPSSSMYPTIKIGDRIAVTRIYNTNKLQRGDIIVFNSKELGIVLVKRLIGLPGDMVDIKENGELYINGKHKSEPYVIQNGGKSGTFKVPANSYFFLGDNRRDSFDAREWKNHYIPADDLVGKAQVLLFPFNRIKIVK